MSPPELGGIHHLKFPVADLARALDFYQAAFGATRIAKLDHVDASGRLFAYILSVPGWGTLLELRLDPAVASRHRGFDPVTLQVESRAELAQWIAHFEASNLPCSDVLVGAVGWLAVVEDPDGRRMRLYTRESHGPELTVSWDSPWIRGA